MSVNYLLSIRENVRAVQGSRRTTLAVQSKRLRPERPTRRM